MTDAELDRYCLDIWQRAGVSANPGAALFKAWKAALLSGRYLGRPEEPEHLTEDGRYYVQAFAGTILHCATSDYVVREGLPALS